MTALKRFAVWFLGLALALCVFSCRTSPRIYSERLRAIDNSLQEHPDWALDSLSALDPSLLSKEQSAYYSLLLTIAQHKNHIPFPGDSAISIARDYFFNHTQDYYNQARASFYHGLVRQKQDSGDTLAHRLMHQARQIMDDHSIQNDRLSALIDAFLGRINYGNANFEEAALYFYSAIVSERRLGNVRNMVLNLSDLLVCQVTLLDSIQAERTLCILDSTLAQHPDIHSENINNSKALFYLHIAHQLDSADYYCKQWKASPADFGAKQQLLSKIYENQGNILSAINCEKNTYENRRSQDSIYYHAILNRLSYLYDKIECPDSSAHYAHLAYQSLCKEYSQKTEKRVLELEKQYDMTAKEAELAKAKHHRTLLTALLLFSLIILAILVWNLYLSRRLRESDHQAKLKDSLARSLLMSVLSSYSGINQRLSYIHNLPSEKRQEALNLFIRENQKNLANNIDGTLSSYTENFPPNIRTIAGLLGGVQQRAVFILTEMGFSINEIASTLSTSGSQVRSVKSAIRKHIEKLSPDLNLDISQLEIMRKDQQSNTEN
jgi:hypothetical protein